ncbi:MAG: porin, partial [Sutterella wadsworthensis]
MGRVGALSAGVGSYNVVYGYTAFGTGWGDTVGAKSLFNLGDRDRMDNTVTYVTPKFGGLTAYAQYSFNANGAEDAQSSLNKRCAGLGLKYDLGAFSTGLVVDTVMNKVHLGSPWNAALTFKKKS